jgi:hypothetical protein
MEAWLASDNRHGFVGLQNRLASSWEGEPNRCTSDLVSPSSPYRRPEQSCSIGLDGKKNARPQDRHFFLDPLRGPIKRAD